MVVSAPGAILETEVAHDDERSEPRTPAEPTSEEAETPNGALASRFQQMFPVLSHGEIDRIRRFGEVRHFPAGELLFHVGEAVPGMYVILSGRVAIEPRDGLGQLVPVAEFARLSGAPLEEMSEVVPGEVIAEIGQLSGRADLSVLDARAVGDVEAIVVRPEALRTLLVAEAELGERILRALILRRVALIELGFGGPVIIGIIKSPEVTRL
jgi:thioredoxin reductase (NADPH)